jgi:hypothetical protein
MQKIPTKIYLVTVSLVEIGAVKVTLYLGMYMAFYPYLPHMSDVGERRLKCLHIGMLPTCCTKDSASLRKTNGFKFAHVP